MKVIALGSGTSQGIPIIGCTCKTCTSGDIRDFRLRSSVHIKTNNNAFQIDVGPDFRQQFLVNKLTTVDHVLITHEHNDHIIGIDDLRAINFTQKKSIPIYAEARVLESIKERFHYAFGKHKYPGAPQITLHTITNEPFTLNGEEIIPIRLMHGNLPILGFKIGDFAYITDASDIEPSEINKIKGINTLIINALQREDHRSHFNLKEALLFINKINPRQAYLTHISHRMGPFNNWAKHLPENVEPLQDNMVITL
ncbi:MAG: MBL fold metallo-hydrolase [Saprospiraceae bacterium]|nr:MBL fold metallo-hydrolase [Bacteroidia bacterium]NNE16331.1 MBL fold metallo-hydrolase [Saprospiraceae bacterium]NNL93935.1 MBL fold metallo-hydrolase [Saprospiraceae bacterium]